METIEGEKRKKMTFWEMINTQHLRTPLIIVCCLQIMQPLTGISVVRSTINRNVLLLKVVNLKNNDIK